MLALVRTFFSDRNVLEADTNILRPCAPVDAHIDIMKVEMGGGKVGYLHSSPEYELKKLLALGSGDIYQLGHVFRAEEEGPWHSPEFTMLEWYRVGMSYEDFIEETLALFRLFLGPIPAQILTYREAFQQIGNIDYLGELSSYALEFADGADQWDRDTQLNLLFSHVVEPKLQELTVIMDFPASQAALAKTTLVDGTLVARRFEVYYRGIELANGFEELTDSKEQKLRLVKENEKRQALGKQPLPIDEEFVACVDSLPDCCGVAVGFDRLVKLSDPTFERSESAVLD